MTRRKREMARQQIDRQHRHQVALKMSPVVGRSIPCPSSLKLLVGGGLLLIVAIVIATATMVLHFRDRALATGKRELANTASILAEQVDQAFRTVELVEISVIESMQSQGIASSKDFERWFGKEDVYRTLRDKVSGLRKVRALTVIDSGGRLINFSRYWPPPDLSVADREYFRVLKADPNAGLHVSEALRNRGNGAWSVFLGRRLTSANGEFLGVILATIDLGYFQKSFQSIALANESAIALFRRDGTLLARHPSMPAMIGTQFVQHPLFDLLQQGDGVMRIAMGTLDGEDRLVAARGSDRYPITIVVSTTTSAALSGWRHLTRLLVLGAALAGGVIGTVLFLIIRQLSRDHEQSERTLNEQNAQFDTALNNMSQGLAMFDSKARLVVCNDRYLEMYDFPPESVRPGCPLREMLAMRIRSGTFSSDDPDNYMESVVAAMARGKAVTRSFELSDGRIIAVSNRPMGDGGWVATHDDVTEPRRREASFRLLFEHNPIPMWVYDRKSLRFLAVNNAAVLHYGYSRKQFLEMTALDIRPAEERAKFLQFLRDMPTAQARAEKKHQRSDGSKIDVRVYSQALSYEGHNARLVAIYDVTESKLNEDELRRTRRFLDTVVENVPLPILVKDMPTGAKDARDCRYSLINRASEEFFGVSRQQMLGKTVEELYPKEDAEFIIAENNATLRSEKPLDTSDHSIRRLGDEKAIRVVTSKTVTVRDDNGDPRHLLSVLDDVTERRQSEQRIFHMAHCDNLTDLPNRAAFNEHIAVSLEAAGRNNEQLVILSVDLDHFKDANDVYGHCIGDALLREVAGRLKTVAGETFLARIGGDEFTFIVFDGVRPASALAERLLAAFAEDFEVEGQKLRVGLSIGGAVYPIDGKDAKTLMSNADAALYRAKAQARGSIVFFEPEMGVRLRERHALQEDLRSAIELGQLLLHYQPQKRMDGQTIGLEALIRWLCPKRGPVSPAAFIPIAEESNLIIPVGEWVLREACREAASWKQPLIVAVNISPIQFRTSNLPGFVHSVLLETGLAPARLELEITEGVFIDDFSHAVSILNRLKSLGVKITLDDFGTGYSSLSYLHSFDFDKIKIDRSFIRDLDRRSIAIVRAIINLGHSLNIPVLGEGVETDAQHAFLFKEGCDQLQGYLTGRPGPIEDYADLVRGQRAFQQKKVGAC